MSQLSLFKSGIGGVLLATAAIGCQTAVPVTRLVQPSMKLVPVSLRGSLPGANGLVDGLPVHWSPDGFTSLYNIPISNGRMKDFVMGEMKNGSVAVIDIIVGPDTTMSDMKDALALLYGFVPARLRQNIKVNIVSESLSRILE
jgi:hypothetical protein